MGASLIPAERSAIRRSMAMLAALALMLAALLAARWGWAAVVIAQVAHAHDEQRNIFMQTGQTPPAEALHAQHEQLALAQKLDPQNPAIMEIAGEIASKAFAISPDKKIAGPYDETNRAITAYARAVVARPVSPYGWANFASAKYQAGQIDSAFYAALQNAARLGPWEPEVQFVLMDLGFALWDEMPKSIQPMIKKIAINAEQRYPDRVMSIAAKRGKLVLVCDSEKLAKMAGCSLMPRAQAI